MKKLFQIKQAYFAKYKILKIWHLSADIFRFEDIHSRACSTICRKKWTKQIYCINKGIQKEKEVSSNIPYAIPNDQFTRLKVCIKKIFFVNQHISMKIYKKFEGVWLMRISRGSRE